MIKSQSTPNFNNFKKSTSSTSLNSLPFHNDIPIELVMLTNSPINKFLSCSIENNKFPDNIINFNNNDYNYAACIETPCEPTIYEPNEKLNLASTISKSYLQLSIENSEHQERYIKWRNRIRRFKNKKNSLDESKDSEDKISKL